MIQKTQEKMTVHFKDRTPLLLSISNSLHMQISPLDRILVNLLISQHLD